MKRYGYFSKETYEFVITRPDTPTPWVNYISNGKYSGLISNTGGGYSFYRDPKNSRITRWRYNSLPIDRPGRYLFIRDRDTGEYWSPTWQPTATQLDSYECRHGLYYTRIISSYGGIKASITYFVPEADDVELWSVSLTNESNDEKELDLFPFVELCLGHALVDLINQPNDQHFNDVHFDRANDILFATKRYWVRYKGATVKQANEAWDKYVYFASSEPVTGWDGSKDQFIGRWRSEANPVAIEDGTCRNTEITAGDAVAVLQTSCKLKSGESKDISFMLGIIEKDDMYRQNVLKVVKKFRDQANVAAAFSNLKKDWRDYLSAVQVETPNENMNLMLNIWNQYQTSVTFRFSRDASYYHGGMLFGRGYRDSCQDIMGPVIPRPEWVRERILEMSTYQFADGSTFHLYMPLTGGGERTGHTDTPLWLPLAIMVYLKETGDFDILKENVSYYDEGIASIMDHHFAAIDYTISNLSPRYLAKFGPGDWNDTLDYLGREGRGESVWVTMFLAHILRETVQLCEFLNDDIRVKKYKTEYEKVKSAVNEHCWDGEWYIRGTNDLGDEIGSAKNEEGRIFLNTQSWAVISGIAEGDRAERCLEAVKKHLDTPKGPKILHPAYTRVDENIGLATRCVPGKKENGAVFNHPVSWAIMAECLVGNGKRAFDIYKKALPMNPVVEIERYEVEPYVYAEYVTSPDHPTYGQASHSWLTGSSTWMLRDGIDHILGVRPDYNNLLIDPCIPPEWNEFRIQRRFRGVMWDIHVMNPDGVEKGVKEIRVNGHKIQDNKINLSDGLIVELMKNNDSVTVEVFMG